MIYSNNILVTVYVVTYQKFASIYDNLWSIIKQDYPYIELLVSDDGSDQFPVDEINEFLQNNCGENIKTWRVIANRQNVGTVKHINSLIPLVKGELMIPLSGDDEFYDNNVVSKIVKEYNKRSFNILSTSRVAIDKEKKQLYYIPHLLDRYVIKWKMKSASQKLQRFLQNRYHNFASGSTMVIRTDFIRQLGGHDERFVLWEDGPFIMKVTNMGYNITTRYDIISIKYRLGGVSLGGASDTVNKIYWRDYGFFLQCRSDYSPNILSRKFIKFDSDIDYCIKHNKMLSFRVKYFDVLLLKKISYLFESFSMKIDKLFISK